MAFIFRATYTRGGKRYKTRVWSACWRDPSGKLLRRSLKTTSRAAAQLKLADLVREAESGDTSAQRHRDHARAPIETHLSAWETALDAKGTTEAQVAQQLGRVRRVLTDCKVATLAGIDADAIELCISRLPALGRGKGERASVQTRNGYTQAIRQFFAWAVRSKRLRESPVSHLRGGNVETDRRHDRRTLGPTDLAELLTATAASLDVFRGLDGRDRHALYVVALTTGLRRAELASLKPASFCLDAEPPVVALPATATKNRRAVRQPLPVGVVPMLRAYLAGLDADAPVWPGSWWERAAKMLRGDLDAAGIAYRVEGPDGPLFTDFHSLRGSYIASLDFPGNTLKRAMTLARHSDPKLTMRRYGKATAAELGAAADVACTRLVQAADAAIVDAMPRDAAVQQDILAFTDAAQVGMPSRETVTDPPAMGPEADREKVRPAGFEPATLGLGNIGPVALATWFALLLGLLLASPPAESEGERRAA